ncbi:hypothetical protein SmJEL517_g04441 [Synchytrium microbalum]|uniref:HotDog ACOT-type domain-containing protein n=1 Tax=Synchytrium microbalum TaxID=1806994 RepID=A0A507BRX9_9FUNG|nr:uncharacterized protein SmJEL517_g04441 [Synchytrium microbalum]TPX32410.1 hypothetical protein SmJEL517_g04441 [Synchytrium microbalum]
MILSVCIRTLSRVERMLVGSPNTGTKLLKASRSSLSTLPTTEPRTASSSRTVICQIVSPTFCDSRGVAYGGAVMSLIDITAGVASKKHSGLNVVTASVDSVAFAEPLREGEIVNVRASVNRAWNTSMEVGVRVEAEDPKTGDKKFCCHAYLTFVGLKALGQPSAVPAVMAETENEKRRYNEADQRRTERNERRRRLPPITAIGTRRNGFMDTPQVSRSKKSGKQNGLPAKPASESYSETVQIVFPGDANSSNVLFGGNMIRYMESIAAIAAGRHTQSDVVTASIDSLNFIRSAQIGDVITLRAVVSAAFTHSVEVYVTCEAPSGITNDGYMTLVAVDSSGELVRVPPLSTDTDEEKVREAGASERRMTRLKHRASLRI